MFCGNTDAAGITICVCTFFPGVSYDNEKNHFVCLSDLLPWLRHSPRRSKWTEEFLMRFNPAEHRSTQAAPPTPVVAGVFQTGTVPIGIQEVINMMLDNNLDIRSNRFTPRSTALQTLVFYRALQPSIRFSATISSDTSASTRR